MRFTPSLLALVTSGAFCASAFAQDSVSKIHGLPGDAIDPRAASEQQNDYIVDQTIVRSSWGTVFGVAPLVKSGIVRNTAPDFFNASLVAQFLSQDLRTNMPFVRSSYGFWNAQGFGVNDDPARNDPATAVPTTGFVGYQFATGNAEFSVGTLNVAGSNAALNNITGALVNFTNNRPSRLYVSRVQAAVNGPVESCNLNSSGMGSVDADGNLYFRADGNGAPPTGCNGFASLPGTGNNLWRIKLPLRNPGVVNVISNTGGVDAAATERLLNNSTVTTNTPNNIPNSLAGRPVILSSNFNKEFVFESSAGVLTNTLGHRPAVVVDHRGSVGLYPGAFSFLGANAIATCGIIGKETTASSDPSQRIALWGVDANGNVTANTSVQLPPMAAVPVQITDPDQPSWSSGNVPGPSEFDHYHSQVAFQGGNSPVAIGKDQQGNMIVAAVVYYGLTYSTPPAITAHLLAPNNYIAVARIDPTGATTQWSVAGWTQETTSPVFSDGKTIYQNGTTPIGRLTGALFGPPISAPMIDSVGNIWFLAGIELTSPFTQTTGLIRAVYDSATFSYKLELVTKVGDVLAGRNSATNYLINFLEIKDSNSISSGSTWSGNVSPWAFRGQSTVGLATSDSATLGGIIVHAGIIYDVNHDGQYIRSTGTGGTLGSPDEDYDVLLYFSSASDSNNNGLPDDSEVTGTLFCAGDGQDPAVTTPCPCSNFGGAGRGCANSVNPNGAALGSSGQTNPDTVVLLGSGMPSTASCIYLQGDGLADTVFGDGVRCTGGSLLRLRTKTNVGGASSFPDSVETVTLSFRGGVTPGSGAVRYYQTYYRNAAAAFCPPATFNVTNGLVIVW